MAEINWGLLGQPNALLMFARGRDDARRNDLLGAQEARAIAAANRDESRYRREEAAAARSSAAREAARPMIAQGNFAGAAQAAAVDDPELAAAWSKMDEGQRARAKEQMQQGAGVLAAALRLPADQRQSYATQRLQALGIDPSGYGDVNWTDDNSLTAAAQEVLSAADQFTIRHQDRVFDASRQDRKEDVQFRGEQFEETKRANRVGEGQRQQQIGISAASLAETRRHNQTSEQQKAAEAEAKRAGKGSASDMRKRSAENVVGVIDSALKKLGWGEAGLVGATAARVPGTKAYDLARDIETIKANLGFEQLQAMREASPTGGALGQVAVQELVALQSRVANLDIGQSQQQLEANLKKAQTHYRNWLRTVEDADGPATGTASGLSDDELKAALGL